MASWVVVCSRKDGGGRCKCRPSRLARPSAVAMARRESSCAIIGMPGPVCARAAGQQRGGITMIPKNITREHVIKAIDEVRRSRVPPGRQSRKFRLEYEGTYYPPKYIISLANKYANGEELDALRFGGGKETNGFLRALGFNIVEVSGEEKRVVDTSKADGEVRRSETRHYERCPECKQAIRELLAKIYGKVEPNYKFEIGTQPEDLQGTPYYGKLKEIYEALQNYRGFKEFVRARTLPACDFFVPKPGLVVEFDESQHFTSPRRVALEHYPRELGWGFDRSRWIGLCERINAKDNDPPYRDEQHAWYDTLRDFLPAMKGLQPTVRLFARDLRWCGLAADDPVDVRRFKRLLEGKPVAWEIEVREDPRPFLARIIIAGEWDGAQEGARKLLEDVYEMWPRGRKLRLLMTCGGFVQFGWPEHISRQDIGDNRHPNSEVVEALVEEAERSAIFILGEGLDERLREVTDYITLGIDSYKTRISTAQNYISRPHIELVLLIDLRTSQLYWTGKSYPTTGQEKGLVRIADSRTHYLDLQNVGRVMVLGCHDLTVFNPRSRNARGWRATINERFRAVAKEEQPTIVLQHPHTTDSIRTWAAAWSGLSRELPTVRFYASAGRYYNSERERSSLIDVLRKTKRGNTMDFIIRTDRGE